MQDSPRTLEGKVALVTGGARRIGAAIVRALHGEGMRIALHYHRSRADAERLRAELEARREDSVALFPADLLVTARTARLVEQVVATFGRLDVLVNNASTFYRTPLATVSEAMWEDLLGTNLRAPFFLVQAAAPHLVAGTGSVVNVTDIYAREPLRGYPVYSTAKAGLAMLTRALARELGPAVRVNAVAPGPILWPEPPPDEVTRRRIVATTALQREGDPAEIARAVMFLVRDATYTTGATLVIDGGRGLGL